MESNPITKEWIKVFDSLNEPQKRWFAATKSIELGYGGVSKVSRATGLSRTTIIQGCHELTNQKSLNDSDIKLRKKGSGRKKIEVANEKLITEIEKILEESSAGDPMSKIKWTCKSTRNISEILLKKGIKVSNVTVMNILKDQGYSLRSNKRECKEVCGAPRKRLTASG